ncbi:MAG: filamentous hemagglutinin N-terminal domain-containing protein, partial [Gammaproteobacteria bacterium]
MGVQKLLSNSDSAGALRDACDHAGRRARARRDRYLRAVLAVPLLSVFSAGFAQVASDIAADGSLGSAISHSGNIFDVTGGTAAGGVNLFHSFARFTVGTGDVANFDGAAGIANIIARVTGGSLSIIDGTVSSSIAGASLYLINPAGLLFGPNAVISVDGSFHATTADFLGFVDGAHFFADPTTASTLSATPVASFGFLDTSPGRIDIQTPTVSDPTSPRFGTPGIATGGSLSIVGGQIVLGAPDGSAPAYLLAAGGNVRIVSIADAGEAIVGEAGDIDVNGFQSLGRTLIQGNSLVDGQNIVVRGGEVEIADATILPGAFSVFGLAPPPDGGRVDIEATESLSISGTAPDPVFGAPAGVLVFAGLETSAPFARVPDTRLAAPAITLSGVSGVTANRFLGGPGGIVSIVADRLSVAGGASVSLVNAFAGDGGLLRVIAREIVLDGTGSDGFTGFAAQSVFNPAYLTSAIDPELTFAGSGAIEVTATDVSLLGGAEITTDSRSFGPSGGISLTVANLKLNASRVLAQSSFVGDSGDVTVTASGEINLTNGGLISAATLGGGRGGAVRITAGQS